MGGFPPVRSPGRNLESGRSVYGVVGEIAACQMNLLNGKVAPRADGLAVCAKFKKNAPLKFAPKIVPLERPSLAGACCSMPEVPNCDPRLQKRRKPQAADGQFAQATPRKAEHRRIGIPFHIVRCKLSWKKQKTDSCLHLTCCELLTPAARRADLRERPRPICEA